MTGSALGHLPPLPDDERMIAEALAAVRKTDFVRRVN
jgi:hypothetical protein